MRIVVAPDSLKESLTAVEAAHALADGIRRADSSIDVVEVPLADGGEGFVTTMAHALDLDVRQVDIVDALGRPRVGRYAIGGSLAVVEAAQAVGLGLIDPADRAIMDSDTRGLGQCLRSVVDAGATDIVVGIGGTATNDGGAGMLAELGVRFLDSTGEPIGTTPRALAAVADVDVSGLDARLADVRIRAACDVNNPLLGPDGASAVYGPQKGATLNDVAVLDATLDRLANAAGRPGAQDAPGAGAAGGLGYALATFLGAALVPGIEIVLDAARFAELAGGADAVYTAEGSIDEQTLMGKALSGVAHVAAAAGCPLVAFAGCVSGELGGLHSAGFTAIFPIVPGAMTVAEALDGGAENLARAAEAATRLLGSR